MRRAQWVVAARAVPCRRRLRRLGAGLAALALTAGTAAFVSAVPAAAAAGPFACEPGFYQVISGQLKELNPVTGVYTPIGAANPPYNAIGYDVLDNYIYGISTASGTAGHLIRLASDGSITDLGVPAGLPPSAVVSGDVDDNGNLIVQSSATSYYSINVSTRVATQFTVTGSAPTNDMVWINGTVYSLAGSTMYAVNLSTHVATAATVPGVVSGTFGSGWSDNPNELFFSDNSTGHIYKITGFTTSSPTGALVLNGALTGNNDGAACKLADSPFNLPTANDDSYAATTNQTLTVSAANGVLGNDVGSGLTAVVGRNPAHGTLTLNPDGSFSYVPAAGYAGPDSFTYTATDQFGRAAATAATVTLTVSLPAAPAAGNDAFSTAAGQTLAVSAADGVLGNDSGTGITVTSNTQPAHGAMSISAAGAVSYTPPAGYSGTDSFSYTITDSFGRSSAATVSLATTPLAAADSYSTVAGQTLAVSAADGVLGNDVGSGLTAVVGTNPAHGTLTLNPDGSFSYVPAAGYAGPDSFTYTATDASGQTSAATTVTVTVTLPAGPSAAADSYATTAGQALAVPAADGVLGNDSGTGITVTGNTQPAHGMVTVSPAGAVDYTPPAGYSGTDSFSYTITDSFGRSSAATVSLATTPVTVADGYAATTNQTLAVSAADGVLGNDVGSGLTAVVGANPAHGTLTLNPDGSFSYVPAAGYAGPDSFTYTATDASGLTSLATTVTLVVSLPAAPRAAGDSFSTSAGQALAVPAAVGVLGNDSGTGITVTGNTQPAHGMVTVSPAGAVDYTPPAGYSGTDSFSYTITDSFGRSSTATVSLTTTPVAAADSYSTVAGQTLAVSAADGVLGNDSGTDIKVTGYTQPVHGTVSIGATGAVYYTPPAGYSGTDSFSYTITDSFGRTSTATVTITTKGGPATGGTGSSAGGGTAGDRLPTTGRTVAPSAGRSPWLAQTGTDLLGLGGLAGLLILAGAALAIAGRRRKPAGTQRRG